MPSVSPLVGTEKPSYVVWTRMLIILKMDLDHKNELLE